MAVLSCTAASDPPCYVWACGGAPPLEPSPSGTGRTPADGSRAEEALNEKTDQDKPRRAHAGAEGTSANTMRVLGATGGDSTEEEP